MLNSEKNLASSCYSIHLWAEFGIQQYNIMYYVNVFNFSFIGFTVLFDIDL